MRHHDEPDEFAWYGMFYTASWKAPTDCQQVKIETQKDNVLLKVYGFIMFAWPNCLSQKESSELSAFYHGALHLKPDAIMH